VSSDAGLLDLLVRQQERYRQMASLVSDQQRVLQGRDLDALLGLVDRKRALLEEIEDLERDLLPLKARWPELKAALGDAERAAVECALTEIKGLLGEIVRLEEEGRLLMEGRRSSAEDEVRRLLQRRRAQGAYGGAPGAGGRP
jgi:hypothetical protein